jgi:outer membrane biosynthesis protein TonB
VDAVAPAQQPVERTDLIAEVNSKARDTQLREGTDPGPRPKEIADFDSLSAPKPPAPKQEPAASPPKQEAPTPPKPDTKDRVERAELLDKVAKTTQVKEAEPTPPEAKEEPFTVSRAGNPAVPDTPRQGTKGRLHDSVKNKGFTGFEALQSEIAPYLQEVRRRVERRWYEALVLRYSGSERTEVVVDCAITPEGKLASLSIVGEPQDRVYAALCKEAIERAAPFGPFPFKVPDMYREENLEIRWTFSFL